MPALALRVPGSDRRRRPFARRRRIVPLAVATLIAIVPLAAARAEPPPETDFTALSREKVMDVEVTSVFKRPSGSRTPTQVERGVYAKLRLTI